MTEIEKRQDRSPVPSAFDYAPAPESREIVTLEDRYGLFIGGEWVEPKSAEFEPTISPATEEPLAEVAYAGAEDVALAEGVYVGLTGPSYETPAEVRWLASLGAHAVGMSTVLECIAARWVGLEVCGVSLVTNAGAGYTGEPLTHEEVLVAGAEAGPRLARVIRRFITDLADA